MRRAAVVVHGGRPGGGADRKVGPFPTQDACEATAGSMKRPWMGDRGPVVSSCYETAK